MVAKKKQKHKQKGIGEIITIERFFFVFIIILLLLGSFFIWIYKDKEVNSKDYQISNLNKTITDLKLKNQNSEKQINSLNAEINQKESELDGVQEGYNSYKTETENILSSALLPPYMSIDNQKVYAVFKLSDGEVLEWQIPFSNLDIDLRKGYFKREYVDENLIPLHASYYDYILDLYTNMANNQLKLCNMYQNYVNYYNGGDVGCNDLHDNLENEKDDLEDYFTDSLKDIKEDGKQYLELDNGNKDITVMDFRPYVDDSGFENVVKDLYYQIGDDEEFINEIWYMVAQLTTYSSDIEETPKYPHETLLSGGGDCEDTSILVASLLKAVPKNWDIELVYIDADNPENPKTVNHVIVYVDTGSDKYFIETTSKTEMNPYGEVEGWYFKI